VWLSSGHKNHHIAHNENKSKFLFFIITEIEKLNTNSLPTDPPRPRRV